MAYSDLILATPGLQNYYKCDETSGTTLADSKGSYPLTVSGSTFTVGDAGLIAGSPASSFKTITNAAGLASSYAQVAGIGDFSLEGWISFTTAATNIFVFGEGSSASNNQTAYIGVAAGKPRIFVRTNSAQGGDVTSSGKAYNDGTPHHFVLVGTRATNNLSLYVDGQSTPVVTTSYVVGTYTLNRFSIGSLYRTSSSNYTPANYAHVATYNTALSTAVIAQHYSAGSAAKMAFLNLF